MSWIGNHPLYNSNISVLFTHLTKLDNFIQNEEAMSPHSV